MTDSPTADRFISLSFKKKGHFHCFGVFSWKSRKCSFAHFRAYLAASVFWHIINELTASGGCACLRHLTASAMFDTPFLMLRLRTRPQQFTSFRGTGTAELRFICPHASLELCLFLVISNLSFLVFFLYNTCCEHSLLSCAGIFMLLRSPVCSIFFSHYVKLLVWLLLLIPLVFFFFCRMLHFTWASSWQSM